MDPNDSEIGAKGPGGIEFWARGFNAVVGVTILAILVFGYALYVHMTDTKTAMEVIAKEIRDGNKVQRFSACILATAEAQREAQYSNPQSFCNRMAQ